MRAKTLTDNKIQYNRKGKRNNEFIPKITLVITGSVSPVKNMSSSRGIAHISPLDSRLRGNDAKMFTRQNEADVYI